MSEKKETIIEIEHLAKSFGDVKAVKDISFSVRKGELFAFLGVNGAGKSTSISIICGQLERDAGTIKINGLDIDKDIQEIKKSIGVVFQSSALDGVLTVKENLKNRASLYGINGKEFNDRYEELDRLLSLKELETRQLKKLSGGQKRRVDIARSLIHKPSILILDEPTTGLDPQTRKVIWNVIDDLIIKQGVTVILTTHYMEEAANADYVVIIDHGDVIAKGTPIDLKNEYTGDFISIYNIEEEKIKVLNKPYRPIVNGYYIEVKDTEEARTLILKYPDLFLDFEVSKGKMDDVFLAVTGKKLVGDEQ